jgi:cell division protein FtsX
MILFASFAVVVPMIIVRLRRKPVSVEFLLACGAGSLFPAAFGVLGTILGLVGANAGYADYMQGQQTVETFIEAQTQLAMARAVALDPLMLGVVLTVILLGFCIGVIHKNTQLKTVHMREFSEQGKRIRGEDDEDGG